MKPTALGALDKLRVFNKKTVENVKYAQFKRKVASGLN
jgi:hypothetical protein